MKTSIRTRAALRLAAWIGRRASEIRLELENHVRDEERRIVLANKRVRGLRLYAAWSRAQSEIASHDTVALKESAGHYPATGGSVIQST